MTAEQDAAAITGLFDLLDDFLAETEATGAHGIHREYLTWLQSPGTTRTGSGSTGVTPRWPP